MYTHQRLTTAGALAAALLLAASATASACVTPPAKAVPRCAERNLSLKVTAAPTPDALTLRVTNNGRTACTVDRIPTVTFGNLDGAARPNPPADSGPYRVAAGTSAYATVLAPPTPADVRVVRDIGVAADPAHHGVRVTAASLGLPKGVRVYDPVTTLWGPKAP
ncbi:hypothetical protein GCM10010329_73310 [Streptomyces spiroverticillatus]|uniref:DUF4232 domain-containing protein n=1 Tax=Streptomyces finlayi TaxID=67296 RepID=A0A918X6B4_9ACTN|nr:DUF4232 domain-containing protein [Streptomyces finlayi]GHA39452.1 hypothetical protein GCM10010329_73310 [Streptomyces spiroverticillatus]GHD14331.1 hypothetical protein GCM10010334_73470 [Streptomyces finlayi]